jgi:hypothetical protein
MVPQLWIIDDFLRNAEEVRDMALSLTYSRTGHYPGRGSVEKLTIGGLEQVVSSIVQQHLSANWPPDHAHSTAGALACTRARSLRSCLRRREVIRARNSSKLA